MVDTNKVFEILDELIECIGARELCEEMTRAMGTYEADKLLSYLYRLYDLDMKEESEA